MTDIGTPAAAAVAVAGGTGRRPGRRPLRLHRAWLVASVTFLVLLASAAFRSSLGVLLVPIEEDLGWSRTETSVAVSLNLLVYGVAAPFAAALLERVGVRRTAVGALLLIAAGCLLTTVMNAPWQLSVLWGLVIGTATGSVALVFGAIVANRWFVARRGLVVGILGAAWATGQLVFLPLLAALVDAFGWRAASLAVAGTCGLLIPVVVAVLRDRPEDVGLLPYGCTEPEPATAGPPATARAAVAHALDVLQEAFRTRPFLLLAGTFFVCGWTTNGIISSHFVPAAHDHGMGATTAAGLLAVVGIFDIVGTIGSGWLTDRMDPRKLLAVYYGLRGLALLAVPALLGSERRAAAARRRGALRAGLGGDRPADRRAVPRGVRRRARRHRLRLGLRCAHDRRERRRRRQRCHALRLGRLHLRVGPRRSPRCRRRHRQPRPAPHHCPCHARLRADTG